MGKMMEIKPQANMMDQCEAINYNFNELFNTSGSGSTVIGGEDPDDPLPTWRFTRQGQDILRLEIFLNDQWLLVQDFQYIP